MNPIKTYHKSGEIKEETWLENDKLHRINKPARIYYNKEGNIQEEFWYLNGIDKTDEINDWIKEFPLPENIVLFKLTWA